MYYILYDRTTDVNRLVVVKVVAAEDILNHVILNFLAVPLVGFSFISY